MTSKSVLKRTRGADYEAPEPVKRGRGRPSDYEPWMLQEAARMAHAAATDVEICERLGISVATLYNWMRDRPDFLEAVRAAKHGPDERVAKSLYRNALDGNVTAQIFWLKNRRPAEFRERQEHELIVPVDTPANPEQLDVRRMALATMALLREAPDAPMIEGSVAAPYDTQEEPDDGYDPIEEDEAFDLD